MQKLIRTKENSFRVIRGLSGKFIYIRLPLNFLNVEVIISNATLNIFSSYLLNCNLSTPSQFISAQRWLGSSPMVTDSQPGRGMLKAPLCGKRADKMFKLAQVFLRPSRFWIIISNSSDVVLL